MNKAGYIKHFRHLVLILHYNWARFTNRESKLTPSFFIFAKKYKRGQQTTIVGKSANKRTFAGRIGGYCNCVVNIIVSENRLDVRVDIPVGQRLPLFPQWSEFWQEAL